VQALPAVSIDLGGLRPTVFPGFLEVDFLVPTREVLAKAW